MRVSIRIQCARFLFLVVCIASGCFSCSQPLFSQTTTSNQAPVPTGEELATAEKLVLGIFSEPIKKAKTHSKKVKVAYEIFSNVDETQELAAKYVLLNKTIEVTREAPAIDLLFASIKKKDELFEIDSFKLKTDAILSLSKIKHSRRRGSRLCEMAFVIVEHHMATNKPQQAIEMAVAAQRIAKKSDLKIQLEAAEQFVWLAKSMGLAAENYASALTTLESNPEDESANLNAGLYQCYFMNDFDKGCKHLAKSNVEKIRVAAELEIEAGETLNGQVARAWWEVALDESKTMLQRRIKERATTVYQSSLPTIKGLAKAKAKKRIEEMGKFRTRKLKPAGLGELEESFVLIVSAKFGVGKKWVDVTEKVRELLESDSNLNSSSKKLGVKDPAPGWNKVTKVIYFRGGKQKNRKLRGKYLYLVDHLE